MYSNINLHSPCQPYTSEKHDGLFHIGVGMGWSHFFFFFLLHVFRSYESLLLLIEPRLYGRYMNFLRGIFFMYVYFSNVYFDSVEIYFLFSVTVSNRSMTIYTCILWKLFVLEGKETIKLI